MGANYLESKDSQKEKKERTERNQKVEQMELVCAKSKIVKAEKYN